MIAYQIKITVIADYWSISICSCDDKVPRERRTSIH